MARRHWWRGWEVGRSMVCVCVCVCVFACVYMYVCVCVCVLCLVWSPPPQKKKCI